MKADFLIASILSITMLGCMGKKEPLVIGHRGAMGHETENTLASIQKALDLGVDMIEIEEYNMFDLNKVILDGNHKIPMLQDVLKLIDKKARLNIELKGANTADRVNFITDVYIRDRGWTMESFLISSFNWDELRAMRDLNANIPIAILTAGNPSEAIPIAKELSAEAINPNYKQLTRENNLEIQEAGFKTYVWTVNEAADIKAMRDFGVDGIITNYPERID